MTQTYLVIYQPGSAWITGKSISEQPLQAHGKYMLELYQANVLRFAGPFANDAGGAAVFEVESEAAARKLACSDPAVHEGLLKYELYRWQLVPWERYVKKEQAPLP